MTVIAFDGKTLAADKLMGNGLIKVPITKIWRLDGGCLVAIAGIVDVGRAVKEWFINGRNKNEFPELAMKEPWGEFVVIEPSGEYYSYCESASPTIFETKFMAWGCGQAAALAAMHVGASATQAVEAASLFCEGCGLGMDTLEIHP